MTNYGDYLNVLDDRFKTKMKWDFPEDGPSVSGYRIHIFGNHIHVLFIVRDV